MFLTSRWPATSVSALRVAHGLREVMVVGVIYLAYSGVRWLWNGSADAAPAHVEAIVR